MTDELFEHSARKWLGFAPAKDRQRRHVLPSLEAWTTEEGTNTETLLHSISRAGTRSVIGQRLVSLVTVVETSFYRNGEQLHALVDDRARHHGAVQVWCAACSSSPDVWTLAMILDAAGVEAKIWATDSDIDARAEAKAGSTDTERTVSQLPIAMRDKYLTRIGKQWSVIPALRTRVCSGIFTLVASTAGRFDAVICRNVLIDFEPEPAKQAVCTSPKSCKTAGRVWLGATGRLNVPKPVTADERLNTTDGTSPRGGRLGHAQRTSASVALVSSPQTARVDEYLQPGDLALSIDNGVLALETVETWYERERARHKCDGRGSSSAERRTLETAVGCLSAPNTAKALVSTTWVASAHEGAIDALAYGDPSAASAAGHTRRLSRLVSKRRRWQHRRAQRTSPPIQYDSLLGNSWNRQHDRSSFFSLETSRSQWTPPLWRPSHTGVQPRRCRTSPDIIEA